MQKECNDDGLSDCYCIRLEGSPSSLYIILFVFMVGGGGAVAVEGATPGEEVPGSIPAVAARSLQAGSVSV